MRKHSARNRKIKPNLEKKKKNKNFDVIFGYKFDTSIQYEVF